MPLGEQPRGNWYGNILKSLAQHYNFNFTTPWIKLESSVRQMLLYGTGEKSSKWNTHLAGGQGLTLEDGRALLKI